LPLRIAVSDDFGASRLVIQYQIHSSENLSAPQEFEVGFPAGKSEFVAEKEWSLANFPLLPGNYISYKAVAWDNDKISGPKQGESRLYTLRLPTLDEIIAEVAREQSGQISEFEKVFTGMGELKQSLEKMTSNLERQKGSNWEKGQELESALEQQNQILNKVEEIKAGLEKSWDKLTKNELVREEVAAKMQQIQNLMQEITTPEMKELMKKIQAAIKELDWEKIRKDLGDFKMSQEDLLKRLDQTLALLKRLQAEQKLDSMAQMLKKMTENQNQINQNIQDASPSELSQLSQPEKMLGEDLESVGEQLQELEKLMQEVPALSEDEMSELEQALNQAENQNDISKMSNQLMQSQGNEAGKTGEKLASSFQDASQQFSEMAEKLSSDEQEKFIAQMQNSLQDLLFLSGQQENLTDQTKQSVQQNQALRDLAAGQISLEEATQKVASDLEKLARETPAVPRKLTQTLGMCANQMSQAALQLSNKNSTNAAYYQTDAMANLNSAAQ
ncbi:MAG: hypothetical protein L0Y74_10925, partial [candidate division Zixibacteria bacterium]|nr:hypothetical protein [candidate division Zixibacteria bacterium]